MRSLESARDALDIVLLSASEPPEHQTIVLLGKPDEGGGVSVIIDGEVPPAELASTLGLLAGAAGPGSPVVAATITPEPPTLTEDELAGWHDLDAAVAEHGAVLCEWFLVGGGHRDRGRRVVGRRAEVAGQRKSRRANPAADGHRLELFGHDVDHALGLLQPAPDRAAPARLGPPGGSGPSTPSSRRR